MVRGVASIFFAVVFLFVGIVHAMSHSGLPIPASQSQISMNVDNSDGESKVDAAGICQCIYCSGVVLPAQFSPTAAMKLESVFSLFFVGCLSPHDPTFQTPPPKSSI